MSEDISISFKVVSDAAVFCDSFRRMWIIFTGVSFLLPGAAGGGVESCCDFFGLDEGAGSSQSLVGVVHLSASLVVEGRLPWVLQPCGRQLSSDPQERSRLGVW